MDNNSKFTPIVDGFLKLYEDINVESPTISRIGTCNINTSNIPFKNPLNSIEELQQQQLDEAKATNQILREELNKAYTQLKQLNDKEASQTLYIKELKADLKDEIQKREAAEKELSSKDWKIIFFSFLSAIISGVIVFFVTKT